MQNASTAQLIKTSMFLQAQSYLCISQKNWFWCGQSARTIWHFLLSLLPRRNKQKKNSRTKVHKLFLELKLNKTEVLYIHLGFYVEFIWQNPRFYIIGWAFFCWKKKVFLTCIPWYYVNWKDKVSHTLMKSLEYDGNCVYYDKHYHYVKQDNTFSDRIHTQFFHQFLLVLMLL